MSFQRVLGVFLRYVYFMRHGWIHFSDLFYWPLIDIFVWGLTSIWITSTHVHGNNLPLILMTGLVFWQISWRGSIDVSICLLQELWQRNLVNLFSTPLKLSEWVVGVLLVSLCKLCLTISFGVLIVYLLYALNVFTIGWAFLPFAVSLLIFGWTIGFLASSAIIYWGHTVEAFAWMIGGLFAPFSAVFYPVDILPPWVQVIAWKLPTTYIFEGMRALLNGGAFPLNYFLMSLSLNLVFLSSSILLFRYMFEKTRAKGLGKIG